MAAPMPMDGPLGAALSKGAKVAPAEDGPPEDLVAAAPDLIAAIKSGDAARVASAFKAMHGLCGDYEE